MRKSTKALKTHEIDDLLNSAPFNVFQYRFERPYVAVNVGDGGKPSQHETCNDIQGAESGTLLHSVSAFRKALPALTFFALLVMAVLLAQRTGLPQRVGGHFPSAILSFALLAAPIWFFGFGAAEWLRRHLTHAFTRVVLSALLVLPYAVWALPRGEFHWRTAAGFLLVTLTTSALLEHARRRPGITSGGWQDLVVLASLGFCVDLRVFESAWPYPGISGISKLLLVDVALYGYLVIRHLDGIGYDLRPQIADFRVGLREFALFFPIAIALGLALGFLHLHWVLPPVLRTVGGWAFTFLFIAIPEELFFRGIVQNLLERRMGNSRALWLTSVLFGLSHFNKRARYFNWRYVILACIAGLFYGRAWRARRRILASAITHTTVDVTWSIWLR